VNAGEGAPADEALERSREAGIHRLQIPTPFAVGRVNCYLLEDDPLTLVDTGPNSGKSLDELEHQLSELGHSISDLELVILTHQHIDHLGLVEIIASRSGADVAAIDARCTTASAWSCATARWRCSTARGTARRTRCSGTPSERC
jgi:glyoxylase-like metal-dependent hydrolase (beta-lactamase superfamily II)